MLSNRKFSDPFTTVDGEMRAFVDLRLLKTIWFNTGSVCNLACKNCYIESSPKNNKLSFLTTEDVSPFLAEIQEQKLQVTLVGITGGEPFANPQIISILTLILEKGFKVLVLTNAYRSIQKHKEALLKLKNKYGSLLSLRVSLDHYTEALHEEQRGTGTFQETLVNIRHLANEGYSVSIAGRSLAAETSEQALSGYQQLLQSRGVQLALRLGENIVIFPEMDLRAEVPEITTECWRKLDKTPQDQMCDHERMIVKKKGESRATVMPCTLLAYDPQFDLGHTLKEAKKRVQLNHPFCATFCVLGGASCSPKESHL